MGQFDRNSKKREETQAAPLDPIALTLALWLGLVVGVTALIRLSENANAARQQAQPQHASVMMLRPMAFAPYGS
jgi:hypothetical protein